MEFSGEMGEGRAIASSTYFSYVRSKILVSSTGRAQGRLMMILFLLGGMFGLVGRFTRRSFAARYLRSPSFF